MVLTSAFFLSLRSAQNEPPPLLVSNFVNLDKVEKFSRYRSCAGHVTVPQDEREGKRNMKLYVWVKPEYIGENTVEVYSPYDGYVSVIRDEPELGLEGEIWISPKPVFAMLPPIGIWSFSVQHIYVREDLKAGDEIKAGEFLGWAAVPDEMGRSFDIVYGKLGLPPKTIDNWTNPFADLDFVFNHMTDEVFAEYQKAEISSREELLISKEERDQNPCVYRDGGPYFENQQGADNWVFLQ